MNEDWDLTYFEEQILHLPLHLFGFWDRFPIDQSDKMYANLAITVLLESIRTVLEKYPKDSTEAMELEDIIRKLQDRELGDGDLDSIFVQLFNQYTECLIVYDFLIVRKKIELLKSFLDSNSWPENDPRERFFVDNLKKEIRQNMIDQDFDNFYRNILILKENFFRTNNISPNYRDREEKSKLYTKL